MNSKKVLGIIAEYNPMHNGHIYHLQECKDKCGAEYVVAVMSGNFTQRGEPALLDKWTRTEMAILAGVDLVIELPFYYACNSAEFFAKGGVDILDNLGVVTHIGFGSESGDVVALKRAAEKIATESDEFHDELKKNLDMGMSFPRARSLALGEEGKLVEEPNNILGVEYLKRMIQRSSDMKPVTVARYMKGYHSEGVLQDIASATSIREVLKISDFVDGIGLPKTSQNIIEKHREEMIFDDDEKYFELLKMKILAASKDELAEVFSVAEGIENKILSEIRRCNSLEELIEAVKSKRYTRTRIKRILTHILMGFVKNETAPEYIRVLGFNSKGSELLKEIKMSMKNAWPIVTNINKNKDLDMSLDIRATDIYNLIQGKDTYEFSDFVNKPVIIR